MTVEELLWKRIETKVDTLVTGRLLAFHDALVARKQIAPIPPASDVKETPVAKP
jgi:hypothetical protein